MVTVEVSKWFGSNRGSFQENVFLDLPSLLCFVIVRIRENLVPSVLGETSITASSEKGVLRQWATIRINISNTLLGKV